MSRELKSILCQRPSIGSVASTVSRFLAISFFLTSCDSEDTPDPGSRSETIPQELARRGDGSGENVPLGGTQLRSWAKSRFENGFANGGKDPIVDLRDKVWQLDAEALVALLKGLEAGAGLSDRALADLAFQRLAHLDPAATLSLLVSDARTYLRFGIKPILRIALDSDLEVVLDWMKQQEIDNPEFRNLVGESMILLGARAPTEGFRLISRFPEGGKKRMALIELFYSWAERDASAAMRFVQANLEGEAVQQLQGSIISGLAKTDPETAFRMLETAESPSLSRTLTANVFEKWFRKDSEEAMTRLGELSPAAVQVVLANRDNLASVLAQDPGEAIEIMSQVVLTDATTDIFSQAVQQLAARNADLTLQWLDSFPDSPARNNLLRSAYEGMLQDDPGVVGTRLLGDARATAHREQMIDAVASVLGRADPDSAILWSSTNLASAVEQGAFVEAMFQAALGSKPLRAVELMADNAGLINGLGEAQQAALWSRAGAISARHDPGSTATWVEGLPESAQVAATEGLVRSWAGSDPNGLAGWIGSLQPGPQHAVAVRTFAAELKESDPQAAADWLSTIRENE